MKVKTFYIVHGGTLFPAFCAVFMTWMITTLSVYVHANTEGLEQSAWKAAFQAALAMVWMAALHFVWKARTGSRTSLFRLVYDVATDTHAMKKFVVTTVELILIFVCMFAAYLSYLMGESATDTHTASAFALYGVLALMVSTCFIQKNILTKKHRMLSIPRRRVR